MEKLKRVVIKEELVALTGDFRKALILNQFIYWSERVKDTDKWLVEEKARAKVGGIEIDILESKGWIYKTAEELNEELMINLSMPTMRKIIKELVSEGYINSRRNPKYNWDKTLQYRVDLVKVQNDLLSIGYALEGYKLLSTEDKIKAPTFGEVEGDENKNSIDNNSICNKDNNNTSSIKNKVENVANKLTDIDKLLSDNNITGIKTVEANKTFTNINILKVAIEECVARNKKSYGYLVSVYKTKIEGENTFVPSYSKPNSYNSKCKSTININGESVEANKVGDLIIEIRNDYINGTNVTGYNPKNITGNYNDYVKINEVIGDSNTQAMEGTRFI